MISLFRWRYFIFYKSDLCLRRDQRIARVRWSLVANFLLEVLEMYNSEVSFVVNASRRQSLSSRGAL